VGEIVAGPLYGQEGILVADCDLRRGLHAKRWFDAVGHYSRADVLAPPAAGPVAIGTDDTGAAHSAPVTHETGSP